MKRALAERAKQSGLPNGVGPATPASPPAPSSSPMPTPVKTETAAANTASARVASSTSPRPKKRLRESVVPMDDADPEDSNANAFYLKHQNRAMASELRQLKYSHSCLERERDLRRNQSLQALEAVQVLQATWTQLEHALPQNTHTDVPHTNTNTNMVHNEAPKSTGSGTSVELTGALLEALHDLRSGERPRRRPGDHKNDDGEEPFMDANDQEQLFQLTEMTENVTARANTLQGWIWSLLQRIEGTSAGADTEIPKLQEQLAKLQGKQDVLQAQLQEMARSRDEVADSEKRVRRGLYRLAAGRVQLKEVLKAIVTSDHDKEAAAAWMEATPAAPAPSAPPTPAAPKTDTTKGENGSSTLSAAEQAQFQKKISDLEQITKARDEHISKLLAEREEHAQKITSLTLAAQNQSTNVPKDDEVKRSDLYAGVLAKLMSAERTVQEMETRETKIKKEWAQALATAASAQTSVEELHAKHMKQWNEMVEEFPDLTGKQDTETNEKSSVKTKAEEIIVLEHKLTQALENVRQAEGTRKTLQEAVLLNDSLQSKLDEIKAKYTALQQSRAANNNNNNNGTPATADGASTPKAKATSSSAASAEKPEKLERPEKSDKSEKLHREYRRVQKQLAAATASKESAKAKLERAEKERDALSSTNARLLRQAAEKDEMNAKSLSTILHLKQLTDQITKEKENLEQQVKSSQQLSLAARLAANARERLSEEIEKERTAMQEQVTEWEQKCQSLAQEKDQIEGRLTQQRAKMSGLLKDVETAKGRCNELSSESTQLQKEKQQMMESLAIAKKEAADASELTARLSKSSGGGLVEGFTAEQLHLQVKHLKNRVCCPVCNARDKKCILMRCRHMFCRNCVDENIKNRSRKCPACGLRFDTKDVQDIWL